MIRSRSKWNEGAQSLEEIWKERKRAASRRELIKWMEVN